MKKKAIHKIGLYTSFILCGTSTFALLRGIAQKNAQEFNQTQVIVENDTISMQQFYHNLNYTSKQWYYQTPGGKSLNVDSLCDFRHKSDASYAFLKNIKLKESTDTVYVFYKDSIQQERILFKLGSADSLTNMPSLGYYNYDVLKIRQFIAENASLEKYAENLNNTYNCTYTHEIQHFLNAQHGIRSWNSYPIKFVEGCFDEISANIAQCLAQRKNYLDNSKNLNFITDRFHLYKQAIQDKKIQPDSYLLSEKEVELIANTVFDSWMSEKFNLYIKQVNSRMKYFLKSATYPSLQDNYVAHNEIMKKFFLIKGYDFWKYLSKRENEIFNKIPDNLKKEWNCIKKKKEHQMSYLEKLEYQKISEGYSRYQKTLKHNKIKAKLISLFGYER